MFSGVQHNELVFATDFRKSDVILYPALLVPQAWSLGVELTFYLIAPFILTKKRVLLILLASSIALRFYIIHLDLGKNDPWTYRFFPTELALFLLGSLSHQILLPYYKKSISKEKIDTFSKIFTCLLIFITISYWLIPINELVKTLSFFSIFLTLMPFAFIFQSKHDWDTWIGDLSYPIYICHIYIISFIDFSDKLAFSISSVIISIGFAILLNKYISNPVELLRNKFRKRAQ